MGAVIRKPRVRKELIFGDTLRLVVIGERASGKTCVWLRFTKNQFSFEHDPTLYEEVAVVTHRYVTEDASSDVARDVAHLVTCEVWDMPPDDLSESETARKTFQEADAIVVVFDCTKADGIDKAVELKRTVNLTVRKAAKVSPVWMLLAAKTDLGGERHTVSEAEMRRATDEGGFWSSARVSAMSVNEVNAAFRSLILHLLDLKATSSKPLSEQIAAAEAEAAALAARAAATAEEATKTAAVANATIAAIV